MISDRHIPRIPISSGAGVKALVGLGGLLLFLVTMGCSGTSTSTTNNAGNAGNSGKSGSVSVLATVQTTVPVDADPTGIAVDSATNSVFVVNSPGYCSLVPPHGTAAVGGITGIDGATDSKIAEAFPFGSLETTEFFFSRYVTSEPAAIAFDSTTNTAYTFLAGLICPWNKSVQSFSYLVATNMATSGYPILSSLLVGMTQSCGPFVFIKARSPDMVAVNPATHKVYAAWPLCNEVEVFDFAAQSVSPIPTTGYPIAVAVNSTTNKLYVANLDSNNVTVIDGATDSILTTIADPKAIAPVAIAVNPTTNTIYVANSKSNSVTAIAGATNSVIAEIAVGTTPTAIDVDSQTNFIYVANAGNSQTGDPGNITVINGATKLTQNLKDANAKNPSAVAVNSVTNKIYVANSASNNVTVIDGAHD